MRCVRVADSPHTTQIASSLSTRSARARSVGTGPNGSPRKSRSRPAQMTRRPFATRSRTTLTMPGSKNWTSSTPTTLVSGREEREDLRARAHRAGDERVAVVRAHELGAEAVVDRRLEDLDRATRDHRALHATDELLALSAEHAPNDDLEATLMMTRGHAGANPRERSRKRPAAPPSGHIAC